MKHILTALTLIALSSCAPASPDVATTNSPGVSSKSSGQHFTLVATTNGGAIVTLIAPAQITFPATLQGLANASGHRRAVLQLGSFYCAYVADNNSVYIRQDGSCNVFYPNDAVSLPAGEKLTLGLESVDSNNYTSVQADLQAGIYN